LVPYVVGSCNGRVDSLRQPGDVRVKGAKDDSSVTLSPAPVEVKEVAAIVGQQNAVVGGRKHQHLGVQRGQDVMPQTAQLWATNCSH
jgi:hypothetical protein